MSTLRKYKDSETSLKAKYRHINEYNRRDRVGISFRLDKEYDKDIIEFLKPIKDKVGFFRRLLREEMNKGGK